jgi:hypothetical protein
MGLPYGVPDGRPGEDADFDASGRFRVQPYDFTEYEAGFFDAFLAGPDRGRTAYLWSHGFDGMVWTPHGMGMTAYPIGTIANLWTGSDGLRFEGHLADTPEGNRVRELIRTGAQIENSVTVYIRDLRYETRDTGDGEVQVVRVAEAGDLIDVSHVVFGQFEARAGIEEVLCRGCTSRPPKMPSVNMADPVEQLERWAEAFREGVPMPSLRKVLDHLGTSAQLMDHYIGKEFSARNRERIGEAAREIRGALNAIGDKLDALEELVSSEPTDSDEANAAGAWSARRARRLRMLELESED